jgi:hypothetical protein
MFSIRGISARELAATIFVKAFFCLAEYSLGDRRGCVSCKPFLKIYF